MRECISRVAQAEACALRVVRVERTLQRARSLRVLVRVERTLQRARSCRWLAAALLMAAPDSALACPVCGLIGTSDNTWAYQAMSAMLIFLPLAMIGATVWWLTRVAARTDAERPSTTATRVDRAAVGGAKTYSHSYVVSGFSRTER